MNLDRTDKIILLVSAVLLLWGIFFVPEQLMLRSEEPRRAIVAMEMIFSGDYLKPQVNGWPYYNKPPVFNWILVGLMQVMGSFEEWIVRLPGQISFVLTAFVIFWVCRRELGDRTAAMSALIFLTGGEILFYGLIIAGQIDLFYTLVVFFHMICLYIGMDSRGGRRHLSLVLAYFFLAVGILTKGLPSLAFHGLTLICWTLVRMEHRLSRSWGHLPGVLLAMVLVGGYFYAYQQAGGQGWIYVINLFKEAASKSTLESPLSVVLGNALAFPFSFLKTMLPWSLLVILCCFRSIRVSFPRKGLVIFSVVFILSNLLPYWLAGHLTLRYLYPFLPFLAIVLAHLATKSHHAIQYFEWFIFGIICLVPIGFLVLRFLPLYDLMPYYVLKVLAAILFSAITIIIWCRYAQKRLLLAILTMAFLKLCSNWIYYPLRHTDEQKYSHKLEVEQLFKLTADAPIMLYGHPEIFVRDASIGPWTIDQVRFEAPMPLSYQHPYYIEQHQRQIMEFHTQMQPDTYYLARAEDVGGLSVEVLHTFIDDWQRRPLVLCRLNTTSQL